MSLRAWVALVAVATMAVVGLVTRDYPWVVTVLIVYVAWTFARDMLPGGGRLSPRSTLRIRRDQRWRSR